MIKKIFDPLDDESSVESRDLFLLCSDEKMKIEKIKGLMEKQADPNFKNQYSETTLHKVCANKSVSLPIIKLLIEKKVDLEAKDSLGETAFCRACENKGISEEIIRFLLENKCDINFVGLNSVFNYICLKNFENFELIKLFVEYKADLNLIGHENKTPLQVLCCSGAQYHIIKYLIDQKSDLNLKSDFNQSSLQQYCSSKRVEVRVIEMLYLSDNNLNFKDDFGNTVLHCISVSESLNFDSFKFLLEKKADPGIEEENGITPLEIVVDNNFVSEKTKNEILHLLACYSPCTFLSVSLEDLIGYPVYLELADLINKKSLWRKETHKYFPSQMQTRIFYFLACFKIFSLKLQAIFPKPLFILIINLSIS